jgi:hypothetical protein
MGPEVTRLGSTVPAYVLATGRIVLSGSSAQLRADPRSNPPIPALFERHRHSVDIPKTFRRPETI